METRTIWDALDYATRKKLQEMFPILDRRSLTK